MVLFLLMALPRWKGLTAGVPWISFYRHFSE
jgi:hypothetical protein